MNKNIIAIAVASLGFIIGLGLLGSAIKNRNKSENTISVTGLGTKKFTSDLITWSGNFSRNSFELKQAYDALSNDRKIIENYLISKGIPKNEIVFSAVDIRRFNNLTQQMLKKLTYLFYVCRHEKLSQTNLCREGKN